MPTMTTRLTAAPRDLLHSWHGEQQPIVRALAQPMVDAMSTAFDELQGALNARDELLEKVSVQLGVLSQRLEVVESEARSYHVKLEVSQTALALAQATATDLTAKVDVTTDRIHVLERQLFGTKSEKQKKTPDARRGARKRRQAELSDEERAQRRAAAAARRQAKLDALRTVTRVEPLPVGLPEGRALPPATSVVYEWRRGELVRVVISREQRVVSNGGAIVTASPVEQVVEGGSYGPALYAKVVSDKVLNAIPLRRQERMFARLGAPLPMSTLSALFHRAGEVVHVLYLALLAHVRTSAHLAADETPLSVLADGKTHAGWVWVFAADDALLFTYSPSRGKGVPESVLGGSRGTLTVDGYTSYNSITGELGRQRGGCWSHARRGLYDVLEHDPTALQPLIDDIGELFYVEELARDLGIAGTADHLALREARSRPVLDGLFTKVDDYLAQATDGRASVVKAVRYVQNQREPLSLFLSDAAVPVHNNLSERALRIVALLRKNSLFAGGDEPAQTYAELLSLLSTCQLHDVDPEDWLADVLLAVTERGLLAEDLLPWNWKTSRGLGYKPYFDTA